MSEKLAEDAGASGVDHPALAVSLTAGPAQTRAARSLVVARPATTNKTASGNRKPMRPSTYAGIALLAACGAAFAQQPLTVPGRSQSAWQQSIDNAACYGYANQTTKVNMARESQTPPRDAQRETRVLTPPRPVEPPLPPAASGAHGASAAVAALGASAVMAASGASAVPMAAASMPPGASGPMPGLPAMPASMAVGASGASDAIYGGDMKMPPLPPPEPPMARYWRAYSDCMQNRGYFVR